MHRTIHILFVILFCIQNSGLHGILAKISVTEEQEQAILDKIGKSKDTKTVGKVKQSSKATKSGKIEQIN